MPLYVGSAFFAAVIDTGASVSVMDSSCVPRGVRLEEYRGPALLTAAGAEMETTGMVTMTVSLADYKQAASFVIVRDCPVPILLGLDFLTSAGIVVDARARAVILPDNRTIRSYESYSSTPVYVATRTCIGGRTAAYVPVSAVEGPSIFDPLPGLEDAKNCIIARDFAERRAYIHIVNLSDGPLQLSVRLVGGPIPPDGSRVMPSPPVTRHVSVLLPLIRYQETG